MTHDVVNNISDRGFGRDLDVERTLLEGMAFLERYGLIVQESRTYGHSGLGRQLSRAGLEAAKSSAALDTYTSSIRDPRSLLHADIRTRALPDFDRGREYFESSVFNAFKRVEITVRSKASLPDSLIGVPLMNNAFGEHGPLRDQEADKGEQEGIRNLFAGAIGVYKNPASHRDVPHSDPQRTLLALMVASELLFILDGISPHERSTTC